MSDARRYAVWPDPRSSSWALESWKSFHFQKLSPPPFTMGAGNWPRILKLLHNIYIWLGLIFYICCSFCVTWLWTWQKRQLWRVDHQSRRGLIYMCICSLWIIREIWAASYVKFAHWCSILHAGIVVMDQTLNMLGMTSVFVGGFMALILDNMIPGMTSMSTCQLSADEQSLVLSLHHWQHDACSWRSLLLLRQQMQTFVIRLKARLRPNIGFTLQGDLAVFTH